MRKNRTPGSVRGPLGNWRSYRDDRITVLSNSSKYDLTVPPQNTPSLLRSPCRNRGLATSLLSSLPELIVQSLVLRRKGKTRAFA